MFTVSTPSYTAVFLATSEHTGIYAFNPSMAQKAANWVHVYADTLFEMYTLRHTVYEYLRFSDECDHLILMLVNDTDHDNVTLPMSFGSFVKQN